MRLILGIIISIGALYLALRDVDLSHVWLTIQNASWGFVFLALGSVSMNTLAKALRWKVLVGPPGQNISSITYLMVLLAGQMLNTILPFRLGDFARAYVLGGMGPGRTYVLGTIVLEKMLDSIAYIILFGTTLLLIPLPDWIGSSIMAFSMVPIAIIGGILLVIIWPAKFIQIVNILLGILPEKWRAWISPRMQDGIKGLEIIRHRSDLIRLVLWTVLIWVLAITTNYLTLLAFDIHLPLIVSVLILVALQAGISIPSIPGRIGLFEYICVLALMVFGIDREVALSFGLLLHAIVLVPTTLAGMISFWILGLSGLRQEFRVALTQQ
jgi:hypothetical protein